MAFLDEIAARLVAQSVGVIGTSIFLSTKTAIPPGNGPFITIVETPGYGAHRTHNGDRIQRPSAQIVVRANTYPIARTRARLAYLALDGVFNTLLSGVFYHRIVATQEPFDLGLEEGTARARVAFNIDAEKEFS